MRNRHLSPALLELGIHDRELAPAQVNELNAIGATRQKRPQPALEWVPPGQLSMKRMAEEGYWLCNGCKRSVQLAADEPVCMECGSPRVEFVAPIFPRR